VTTAPVNNTPLGRVPDAAQRGLGGAAAVTTAPVNNTPWAAADRENGGFYAGALRSAVPVEQRMAPGVAQ
jgi:hypothetical protein